MQAEVAVEEKPKEKKNGKKKGKGGGIKDTVIDPSWKGKFIRARLVDGSEISGKLEMVTKFEIQIGRLVVFKHAIMWVELVSG